MLMTQEKMRGIDGTQADATERGRFADVASRPEHPDWKKHIEREIPLYSRGKDIRSEYERDYTRILHSPAYRRLKHKTQVFFNIDNDHICTRMEHVQHVESVSCTIAKELGLNVDLTRAIAMGHDLGHAPFGHEGETELSQIREENGMDKFWHERNSLRMTDCVELLPDDSNVYRNLNLTYAVRDGIISHCGEVDDNGIRPRKEAVDLAEFRTNGQYQPYTWEGCVVKLADKIAYLGRDIEDARCLHFISEEDEKNLSEISGKYGCSTVNTTILMHRLITGICEDSSPDNGISLNDENNALLRDIKDFNYRAIYKNPRFDTYRKYAALVIRSIYEALLRYYDGENTPYLLEKDRNFYPRLIADFSEQLLIHSELLSKEKSAAYGNKKIYGRLESRQLYVQAIADYISGMTDRYAIEVFEELLRF